ERCFEPSNVWAVDEGGIAYDRCESLLQLPHDRPMLDRQIEELNGHSGLTSLAGLPAYMPGVSISLVTTAPAPITVPLQMLTGRMVAFDPIETRSPISVWRQRERSRLAGPPLANVSLMKHTAWETKQSTPIVTPS